MALFIILSYNKVGDYMYNDDYKGDFVVKKTVKKVKNKENSSSNDKKIIIIAFIVVIIVAVYIGFKKFGNNNPIAYEEDT